MTRVAKGAALLLACAVALVGVLLAGSPLAQPDQIFDPQPYLVYEAPPEPVVTTPLVDLRDQFNLWLDVPVLERHLFMNPVEKIPLSPPGTPEPITDPLLHYRWYRIDVPDQGTRVVRVTNQFADDETWEISAAPEFLLAPASKIIGTGEPGPPPPGQHYDCYDVLNAPPLLAVVDLNDQFGPHGPSEVLDARYLCAPAEKTREDGTVYPIFEAADGRDHLACYDVVPEPWPEQISTRDQFTDVDPDESITVEERMLCVPTAKAWQSFEPQPYLVYEAPPEPVVPTPMVNLQDQFKLWEDVPVLERHLFMNPVEKIPLSPPGTAEPITDPLLHYRWYRIDVRHPRSWFVQVTNQFSDDEPWEILGEARFLLAPASKIVGTGEPGPPPPGQHYDCYDVLNAPPGMAVVDLNDQFGPHGPSEVMNARYLCAPAEKTREDGTVYPIFEATDPRDHLACYDVTPEPWIEFISTRDQFTGVDPDQGEVIEYRMLCVPSAKTVVDIDGDGIPDAGDNCPYEPNPLQTDTGGLGSGSPPDGIGDACQCGDINNNGEITGTDATFLKRALLGLGPYFSTAGSPAAGRKCNINGGSPGVCTGTDATFISRALLGLAPGILQDCPAANP